MSLSVYARKHNAVGGAVTYSERSCLYVGNVCTTGIVVDRLKLLSMVVPKIPAERVAGSVPGRRRCCPSIRLCGGYIELHVCIRFVAGFSQNYS